MRKPIAVRLQPGKKAAAAAAGIAALGLAIAIAARSTPARAQSPSPQFAAVSIQPCNPGTLGQREPRISAPGRLSIGCGLLADTDNTGMIQVAFNRYAGGQLNSFRVIPIEGGPDWIHSQGFAIDAPIAR